MLVGSAAIAGFGCHAKTPTEPSTAGAGPAESSRARVTAAKPERKTISLTVTQPGQIEAFDQAKLYAKIPAYVEEYRADIGDRVERGQVLAELSAPELDQELQQKKALVAQAGADVEQAQAAIKVAQADEVSAVAQMKEAAAAVERVEAEFERWDSEYKRVVQLVSRSAVTQKLADETKAQMLAAAAARKEAEARIESAESAVAANHAQVEKKRADEVAIRARRQVAEADEARTSALLNYLRIEAPFDGAISERNADIGYFAQGGGGDGAQPLFTVVRTDRVRVFIDLPEMDAPLAGAGDPAVVRVQSLSGRDFPGEITRTAWALDPTSRTLHTEVDVPNESGELRPGMYAQVTIDLAEAPNALIVPAAAVVAGDNATWCFVVEDGKAKRKPVFVGLKSGNEVEITSGLDDHDLVIQTKGASLTDGQSVELVEPPPAK
ncbi:MAG: efflux RND transporter periplasmic adaptor subunit [Planctomycetia bacterium]|nr:efflux RND transporter periplasmic adaptor subunit [Planctomycetia bacterium]